MATVARVDISLGGRHYPIACDDGQEDRVRRIAAYIDKKITTMGSLAGRDRYTYAGDGEPDAWATSCSRPIRGWTRPAATRADSAVEEEESVAASISQLAGGDSSPLQRSSSRPR